VIGGFDISFREDGAGEEGVAVLALLSFPELEVSPSLPDHEHS
jgi:deoxyinosine 3'endonuclease (endonuclease V)